MKSIGPISETKLLKTHAQHFLGWQTTQQSVRIPHAWKDDTHLIKLIAQIYRVDVVAFKVGKHDNLPRVKMFSPRTWVRWRFCPQRKPCRTTGQRPWGPRIRKASLQLCNGHIVWASKEQGQRVSRVDVVKHGFRCESMSRRLKKTNTQEKIDKNNFSHGSLIQKQGSRTCTSHIAIFASFK